LICRTLKISAFGQIWGLTASNTYRPTPYSLAERRQYPFLEAGRILALQLLSVRHQPQGAGAAWRSVQRHAPEFKLTIDLSSTLDIFIKHALQFTHGLQPSGNIYMSAVRPFRCFDSRVIVAALTVAAWLLVSAWLSRMLTPASPERILLALGQAGALAALVFVIRRSITQMDEFARHIHYQALAMVAAIMVTAISGWAFLERAGLPHIEWSIYAAPAFTVAWGVLVTLISRRYE
jgi:hypothetical protein